MPDVYVELAERLNQLPNGFPRTETGVELRLLQKIFEPSEAEMAIKLLPIPETVEAASMRLGMTVEDLQPLLDQMVEKGQIGSFKMFGAQVYVVVPFIVGIYEFQLNRMDKELANLIEEYSPYLMPVLGGFSPALTRVIPVNAPIEAEHQVYRHEDVRAMINKAKSFQVCDCICRKERQVQGHTCDHTMEVCLAISSHEDAFDKYRRGRVISKLEALDVMELAEKEGLVHTTYNVQAGHMYICNCCSCCCGILLSMKKFKSPYLMAKSNYVALIDQDKCIACGVCAHERCPVGAILETDGVYNVQPDRCIGCGACTTGCDSEAVYLIKKPENERDMPPKNLLEWYSQRSQARGVTLKI